jgi:hypothetical protein
MGGSESNGVLLILLKLQTLLTLLSILMLLIILKLPTLLNLRPDVTWAEVRATVTSTT